MASFIENKPRAITVPPRKAFAIPYAQHAQHAQGGETKRKTERKTEEESLRQQFASWKK